MFKYITSILSLSHSTGSTEIAAITGLLRFVHAFTCEMLHVSDNITAVIFQVALKCLQELTTSAYKGAQVGCS